MSEVLRFAAGVTDASGVVVDSDLVALGAESPGISGRIAGFWVASLRAGAVCVHRLALPLPRRERPPEADVYSEEVVAVSGARPEP